MDPTQNTQDHEMAPPIAGIGSHNPTPATAGLPHSMGAPHLQQPQMGYAPMYGGPPQPMGYAHHGQMSMMNTQPMDYASVGGGYGWQSQPPYQQYGFGMQQQPQQVQRQQQQPPQIVVAPPAPAAYADSAPPRGSPPVEHARSTEGERRPSQTVRRTSRSVERLREAAMHSRPLDALEDENSRLREEVLELQEERISLRYEVDRARLERDHLRERLSLLEGRISSRRSNPPSRRDDPRGSYHPYPRLNTRDSRDESRESSAGPERSRPSYRAASSSRQHDAPPAHASSRRVPVAAPAPQPRLASTPSRSDAIPSTSGISAATPSQGKGKARDTRRSSPPIPIAKNMAKEMDELEDDDDFSEDDDELRRKEALRQTRAANRMARKGSSLKEPPTLSYSSNRELHGSWTGFVVDSVNDYDRLYDACMNRDVDAIGYFSYLNSAYQPASMTRTPGIMKIIKGYRSIAAMDKEISIYKARLKAYRQKQQQDPNNPAASGSSRPAQINDEDAPMTLDYDALPMLSEGHVIGAQEDVENYHSVSPPLTERPLPDLPRDPMNSNPRDPPQAVGQDWAQRPVDDWPRGMRVSDNPGPRQPTLEERLDRNLRLTPHLPDVQAIRYLTELSPFRRRREHSTRLARQNWLNQFITLFSTPGLYRHIVETSGFSIGNRRRERFPFATNNLGLVETAIWVLDHGLHPGDPQVQDNETWAQHMRSLVEKRLDGNWEHPPFNLANAQQTLAGQLSNIRTEFHYPPRAPSAHPRSWSTSTEISVDHARQQAGLPRLLSHVNRDDELDEEMTDLSSKDSGATSGQVGTSQDVA